MTRRLTVGTLFERMKESLELEILGPDGGLDREITSPEASSPGLVLSGYVNRFPYQRIQVLGETEISYLQSLDLAPAGPGPASFSLLRLAAAAAIALAFRFAAASFLAAAIVLLFAAEAGLTAAIGALAVFGDVRHGDLLGLGW